MFSQSLPRKLHFSIIGSAIIHIGVVVSVGMAAGRENPSQKFETVITTKLVRLGKERPKELLPRKVSPPPPNSRSIPITPKADARNSDRATKAQKSNLKDRIQEMSRLTNALQRLKKNGDEIPEGQEDGSLHGELSHLSQALIGNKYMNEIGLCLKENYAIEGIPPERIKDRHVMVFTRVNSEGSFFDYKIEKSSGLKAFDNAVLRAVKRCAKVSPPPVELKTQLHKEGVEFEFRP